MECPCTIEVTEWLLRQGKRSVGCPGVTWLDDKVKVWVEAGTVPYKIGTRNGGTKAVDDNDDDEASQNENFGQHRRVRTE